MERVKENVGARLQAIPACVGLDFRGNTTRQHGEDEAKAEHATGGNTTEIGTRRQIGHGGESRQSCKGRRQEVAKK